MNSVSLLRAAPRGHARFGLLLLFLAGLTMQAQAASPFPAPPKSRVTVVGTNQQALGMQLEIRRFETRDSVEKVLDFYRRHWKNQAAESEMPPWRLIGRLQDGHYYNVQVQPRAGSGSWGYLSISDLPRQARKRTYRIPEGADLPRLSGSRVLDIQKSEDPHKAAQILVLENRFSLPRNRTYYRDHYLGQGWHLQLDEAAGRRSHVLHFRRGREQVTLTLHHEDGRTHVVINRVRERVLPW